MIAASVGEGTGVGVGGAGVVVGTAGSGALALLTPTAVAMIAITTTAPEPSTSGRRVWPPRGSLIDLLLVFREPSRGGARVVGDQEVGSRAPDTAERLQHRRAFVERTRCRSVVEHRKFAA